MADKLVEQIKGRLAVAQYQNESVKEEDMTFNDGKPYHRAHVSKGQLVGTTDTSAATRLRCFVGIHGYRAGGLVLELLKRLVSPDGFEPSTL